MEKLIVLGTGNASVTRCYNTCWILQDAAGRYTMSDKNKGPSVKILVTTHNEGIVNSLQRRVITLKDGKIVSDQKNNGTYKLEAEPAPKMPVRKMQMPGHALKVNRRVIQ